MLSKTSLSPFQTLPSYQRAIDNENTNGGYKRLVKHNGMLGTSQLEPSITGTAWAGTIYSIAGMHMMFSPNLC